MKVLINLILSFLILLNSSGLTVNFHYCSKKLHSVGFYTEASICQGAKKFISATSYENEYKQQNCCQSKQLKHYTQNYDHKNVAYSNLLSNSIAINFEYDFKQAFHLYFSEIKWILNWLHPLIQYSLIIMYQVFII